MIWKNVDPKRIILWHHMGTSSELLNLVEDYEWFSKHPILVFNVPNEFLRWGDYMPNDGHKRIVASMGKGLNRVPVCVLENTMDISETIMEESRPYYKVYRNLVEIIKRKCLGESMFLSRLEEVREVFY